MRDKTDASRPLRQGNTLDELLSDDTTSTDLAGALPSGLADQLRQRRREAARRAGARWPTEPRARVAYLMVFDSRLLNELLGVES